MRKTITNLLALLIAFFMCQGLMAQNADGVIFEASFTDSDENFYVEGNNGPDHNVWEWRKDHGDMYADAFGKVDDPLENHLVSPEIVLGKNNMVSFSTTATLFSNIKDQVKFCVREIGGSWTYFDCPVLNNKGEIVQQEIVLPADFNGKKVQIGIRYKTGKNTDCGSLYVDQIVIREGYPAEKADPQISFNVGDVEAVMGQPFEAPVLNNPNNVEVAYSSAKPEIATVDAVTGAVTLVGEGFTTITATSVENDTYKSAAVNYVLTVKPAAVSDIVFEESFETGFGEFVVEGFNGIKAYDPIWRAFGGAAIADAYGRMEEPMTNYLVSPEFTLSSEGNVATFDYSATFFIEENIKDQMRFAIREAGGEWEYLEIPTCMLTPSYLSSGDIVIPEAYSGRSVQVAFNYSSVTSLNAGVWSVKNLVVKKIAAPQTKKDPQISFEKEAVEYNMAADELFVAPALINPNNVEVAYASGDEKIATVDMTGKVVINGVGEVIITATSVETDEFKSATASYTITVIDVPTGIEVITAEEIENGKVYDLQGRRVNKLTKGIFIVNGKKVVIR